MDELQVPRRQIPARIVLDDGRTLDGSFYAALLGADGRPEGLGRRLNDPGEEFLPVAVGEDRFLINKAGIIAATVAGDEEVADLVEEGAHEVPVRLTLAGGMGLIGRLPILMPAERSRVLDYLNAGPRFLPLVGEDCVTLVQRRFVVSVRSAE